MASVWKIQDIGASQGMACSGLMSCSLVPLAEGLSTSAVTSQWPEDHPGDGQRAERVHGPVPAGRGGRVDTAAAAQAARGRAV